MITLGDGLIACAIGVGANLVTSAMRWLARRRWASLRGRLVAQAERDAEAHEKLVTLASEYPALRGQIGTAVTVSSATFEIMAVQFTLFVAGLSLFWPSPEYARRLEIVVAFVLTILAATIIWLRRREGVKLRRILEGVAHRQERDANENEDPQDSAGA